MRLKIFHKLFLVLVGTSVCSLLLFASFAHWYAQRSFLRYLNDEREARLSALSEQLLVIHGRDGDWRSLRDDGRAWRRLLREAMRPTVLDDERPAPPPPLHMHDGAHGGRGPRNLFGGPHIDATLYDTDFRIIVGATPYRNDLRLHPISEDGRTGAAVFADRMQAQVVTVRRGADDDAKVSVVKRGVNMRPAEQISRATTTMCAVVHVQGRRRCRPLIVQHGGPHRFAQQAAPRASVVT